MAKDRDAATSSQKQIFMSYSHHPPENADFVRNLAGRLSVAGFFVWLDEEVLPSGAPYEQEIPKAVDNSEVGIFIATERWVERPWTRQEVRLFGERRDDPRLVVIEREVIDTKKLGPYLAGLHRISWPVDDSEPDARFWEVYCGIMRQPPGPRASWPERGRSIVADSAAPDGAAPRPPPPPAASPRPSDGSSGALSLACAGRPIRALIGDAWTFVVTDLDEWVGIGPDGLHPPVPRLSGHIAAILADDDMPLVGMCEPMIARLRDGEWDYQRLSAPAFSLCAGPGADYAGTAAGTIVRLDRDGPKPLHRLQEPIIALAAHGGGLTALGAQGMFGRLPATPAASAGATRLQWLESGAIQRPVGFFPAVETGRLGLFGTTRLALIDPATGTVADCPLVVEHGIRRVEFLGPQRWPYAVLTDDGDVILVDASLTRSKTVALPEGAQAAGCCGLDGKGAIAAIWTRAGGLYRVKATDSPAECLISENVVLAYSAPTGGRGLAAVTWSANGGAGLLELPR